MKTGFGEKLVKCSVCGIGYLRQGLANHIINTAKAESFRQLNGLLHYSKNSKTTFSTIVVLRNNKHLNFWRKHQKLTKKFSI